MNSVFRGASFIAIFFQLGCGTITVNEGGRSREVPTEDVPVALVRNYAGAATAIFGVITGNEQLERQGLEIHAQSVAMLSPLEFEARVERGNTRIIEGEFVAESGETIALPDTECRFDLDTGERFCLTVDKLADPHL